jgi:hypothetical protein
MNHHHRSKKRKNGALSLNFLSESFALAIMIGKKPYYYRLKLPTVWVD